jgi:hypothetical protein
LNTVHLILFTHTTNQSFFNYFPISRNYVVQYVLELKIPSANAHLASQFKGRYVYLSKQKVSSNVVEKCLRFFMDDDKAAIVHELIKGSHFEQLLQDPYANYVIYTALLHTKVCYISLVMRKYHILLSQFFSVHYRVL